MLLNMKQSIYLALSVFAILLGLTGCYGAGAEHDEGGNFRLTASFQLDSATVLDHLVLLNDNHLSLLCDTLQLDRENKAEFEGRASTINELFLCSDGGELCRMYAMKGMNISVNITSVGDSLEATFSETETDSINPWLQSKLGQLSRKQPRACREVIDVICHEQSDDVRSTLLLREAIDLVQDSIFVRRCLGALTQEAKPSWLVKSIEQILSAKSTPVWRNRRLTASTFNTSDTILFEMTNQRSDYLLVYLWADYSQASIDTLKVLDELVNEEYDMKRLFLASFCLNAPDSAWWLEKIEDIDGRHVWLPSGLSDVRIRDWRVRELPCLILCDMYNNIQQYNVWGKSLRDALYRIPNRSGFVHTNKNKSNGRPNNLSRPARH